MKTRKIISLVLILCLLLALCACGQHSGGPLGNAGENTEAPADPTDTPDETAAPDDGTDEPDDGTDQPDDDAGKPDDTDEPGSATGEPDAGSSPADVSAAGMENFIKKLSAGNYVVSGNEDAPQTNAVSPDQVYIVYGDKKNTSQTFAFMTLNGETFQAMIDGNGKLEQIAFLSTDNAIAYLGDLLPNSWITLTGNIWDLFYNNPENPLEFTSNDGTVKKTLAGLGGFGQFTLSRMEEVHMVLDAQDPETVHFTAVITDAYPVVYDDLDVTLRFGAAKENNRIKQWMNKPEYPAGRTEWTENDIYLLESIYNRDYGDKVLPFPAVSTYAMNMEEYTYQGKPGFLLTDPHWTEKDVEDYRSVLKTFGYTEESGTLTDGSTGTVYRKLLRGDYKAYAQLSLEYDYGLVLAGTRYYDAPSYDGLAAISGAVQENGSICRHHAESHPETACDDHIMECDS